MWRLLVMASRVKVIDLEDGMPTVPQARTRLIAELQIARRAGVAIVKIIHGYGSSGVGGDLRIALQATLRQMADRGEIHTCIFGENWRRGDADAWALVKRFPDLKSDSDFDKRNNGITLVVL
jgi:DNA-nicking Smr family endonuclease